MQVIGTCQPDQVCSQEKLLKFMHLSLFPFKKVSRRPAGMQRPRRWQHAAHQFAAAPEEEGLQGKKCHPPDAFTLCSEAVEVIH